MSRFAISDIHGCLNTFKEALNLINFNKKDKLILLGDYIDRGLYSKEVIDYILELIKDGYNVIPLKGNHEDFLLTSYNNEDVFTSWYLNGGQETLKSYGFSMSEMDPYYLNAIIEYKKYIPNEHWDFLSNLKYIHEETDYVFVHAGLNFYYDDPIKQTPYDDMIWNRIYRTNSTSNIIFHENMGWRTLVTGHTPTDRKTMLEMFNNNEYLITIDNGCYFNHSNFNHLAIFDIDNKKFEFVKNIDNIQSDYVTKIRY